jgi:hypothetical protein
MVCGELAFNVPVEVLAGATSNTCKSLGKHGLKKNKKQSFTVRSKSNSAFLHVCRA